MMKPDYIFISGVSRTGSTLLLRTLNKSGEVAISRENYFLGHQLPREGIRYIIKKEVEDLSDEANAAKLVEFLYSGKFKRGNQAYWAWLRKRTKSETFLQKLLAVSDRSDRTIFAIMMEMYGCWLQEQHPNGQGRLILGEKTPSHIYYVPTLLEWFPNSKVIHTYRDPRAIFASELRRRKKYASSFPYKQLSRTGPFISIYILLQVTYAWLRTTRLHFKYEQLYPDRYYLSKFENFVTNPEESIKRLCDFLEIEFQESMLEQKVVSRGFKQGQAGFDKEGASRWKKANPPWVNAWFLFCGKKYLRALGYTD